MWFLLACLALQGLLVAPQEESRVFCDDLTPMTDLFIAKLRGDWVAVSISSFDAGVPRVLPTPGPPSPLVPPAESGFLHSEACVHVRLDANSSEDSVSGSVDSHFRHKSKKDAFVYRVTAEQKGRWSLQTNRNPQELLVIAAEGSRYLVAVECRPLPSGVTVPAAVLVLSRYETRHGIVALDQGLADVIGGVGAALGVEDYRPLLLDTNCYRKYIPLRVFRWSNQNSPFHVKLTTL